MGRGGWGCARLGKVIEREREREREIWKRMFGANYFEVTELRNIGAWLLLLSKTVCLLINWVRVFGHENGGQESCWTVFPRRDQAWIALAEEKSRQVILWLYDDDDDLCINNLDREWTKLDILLIVQNFQANCFHGRWCFQTLKNTSQSGY
jgi:hypothetical protein